MAKTLLFSTLIIIYYGSRIFLYVAVSVDNNYEIYRKNPAGVVTELR